MTDCGNSEIRELLPDMLHNSLSREQRERVLVHLNQCADCQEEYDLLRSVYAMGEARAARAVDVKAITAAIAPYRKRSWSSLPALVRVAAAVGIVAVGTLSYSLVNSTVDMSESGRGGNHVAVLNSDSGGSTTTASTDPVAVSSEINSIDDQTLQDILAKLQTLDGSISTEPRPIGGNPSSSGSN